MKVIIKQAERSDIPEISKLFDAYRIFYRQESNLELASKFLTERINNSESVIFLAITNENEYIGFTQLYPSFSSVSAEPTWILNDLYVDDNARGKSVGKKLLKRAKEFAIETNVKGIALSTAKTNDNAQRLYKDLGYEKDVEFYHYFLTL